MSEVIEIWSKIPDTINRYASNQGRIRRWNERKSTWIECKQYANSNGYQLCGVVRISTGKRSAHYVHRLVCAAFYGWEALEGMDVDHMDGDRGNNRLDNLQVVSHAENMQFQVSRDGTHRNVVKTHCPRGHSLDGVNLIPSRLARGERSCLACDRLEYDIRTVDKPDAEALFEPMRVAEVYGASPDIAAYRKLQREYVERGPEYEEAMEQKRREHMLYLIGHPLGVKHFD